MQHAVAKRTSQTSPQQAPSRLTDRHLQDHGDIMHLQRTIGNRAVTHLMQPQLQRAAASGPATIQRTISVGKEQLFFKDYTEALHALKSTISQIDPAVLEIILSAFDADKEYNQFHNLASLKQEVEKAAEWMTSKDSYNVDPDKWGVLHRLKGKLKPQIADLQQEREEGSFKRFLMAQDEDADLDKKRIDYEKTHAKYDPSKFNNDGSSKHTWEGNEAWLEKIMGKFTQMLLTDLPLNAENIKRQTERKHGFSAYAREIAALLGNDYLPVGRKTFKSPKASVDTVSMVHKSKLPRSLMTVINQKIKINKTAANKIYNDSGIGGGAALEFFDEAGLPTDKTPDKSLKLEKIDKSKESVSKEITDDDRIQFLKTVLVKGTYYDKMFWKGIQEDAKGKVYFAGWGFKKIETFANMNSGKIFV